MPRWNIQYVYQDEEGKTRISMAQIVAATEDKARQAAAKTAPAMEFVVSIQMETEEQALGMVRRDALRMAGRTVSEFEDTSGKEPDGKGSG